MNVQLASDDYHLVKVSGSPDTGLTVEWYPYTVAGVAAKYATPNRKANDE